MQSENILVWNVRGLNDAAHRDAVRHFVSVEHGSLVCLQETKMALIDDYLNAQIVGAGFDFTFLPAVGTRGGILVAWRASTWAFININRRTFSLSGRLKLIAEDTESRL